MFAIFNNSLKWSINEIGLREFDIFGIVKIYYQLHVLLTLINQKSLK